MVNVTEIMDINFTINSHDCNSLNRNNNPTTDLSVKLIVNQILLHHHHSPINQQPAATNQPTIQPGVTATLTLDDCNFYYLSLG